MPKVVISSPQLQRRKYSAFSFPIRMILLRGENFKVYWGFEMRVPATAEVMNLRNFQKIRTHLHFNNNDNDSTEDPYFKIRPVIDSLREAFKRIPKEKYNLIDDILVAYKGKRAGFRKIYIQQTA